MNESSSKNWGLQTGLHGVAWPNERPANSKPTLHRILTLHQAHSGAITPPKGLCITHVQQRTGSGMRMHADSPYVHTSWRPLIAGTLGRSFSPRFP